jgi:hypothetical protein
MESGVFESEGDDCSNDDFCFFSSAKVGEWEAHLESMLTPGEESCCVTRETSPKTAHNPHNPHTHTHYTHCPPPDASLRARGHHLGLVSHPTSTSLPTRHRLVIPPLSLGRALPSLIITPSALHVARARLMSQNFFYASGPCCTSCSPHAEARRRRASPHHQPAVACAVTHSDVQFDHAVHHNNPSLLAHFTPPLSLSRSTFPANMSDDPSCTDFHGLDLSEYDQVVFAVLSDPQPQVAAVDIIDENIPVAPALVGESTPPYPTTHASAQPPHFC